MDTGWQQSLDQKRANLAYQSIMTALEAGHLRRFTISDVY